MMNEGIHRVLIADDEEKVCELIRYLIPWEELGLQNAAMVSNGLEAIDVLSKEKIDIVITDARMPECDGIELVKWCRRNRPEIRHIVISGYRHFEYAHSALQHGVEYYLLKPINQNELIDSLREIIQKIKTVKYNHQNEMEIQLQMDKNRHNLRRHFINDYVFDGRQFCVKEIHSIEIVNEEYQMNFGEGLYQALFIKIDNVENADYKIDKLSLKIKALAEEKLKDFGNEVVGAILHSGVIFLINYSENREKELRQILNELYEEIEKLIDVFEGLEVTIGVSKKEKNIKNIKYCITTAGESVKYRIRLQHKKVIYHEEHEFKIIPLEQLLSQERKALLKTYLQTGNRDGMKKLLFDCKREIKVHRDLSPIITYDILQNCGMLAMNVFYEILDDGADEYSIFQEFDESIDRIVQEERLWGTLEELLLKCTDILRKEMQSKETKPIRLIKEYIDNHYTESISLELVAEKAGLTANYVSAVFRKETGVTFSEYIIARRMNKAAELLRKSRMSIAEIAEAVGYTDEKYFSKLCKKTLGMKPSEYRKLYS